MNRNDVNVRVYVSYTMCVEDRYDESLFGYCICTYMVYVCTYVCMYVPISPLSIMMNECVL